MSVTPDFVGQRYKDTNTGNIWIANSTTPGDWTLEVQDLRTRWLPTSLVLSNLVGFTTWADLPGLTKLQFFQTTSFSGFDIWEIDEITEIDFPNLVATNPDGTSYGGITIADCPEIVTVLLPNLSVVNADITLQNNQKLANAAFPSLTALSGDFYGSGNAFTQASVDAILAALVAIPAYGAGKTVGLAGGTSSTPSAQGILDAATLVGRGANVSYNP